MIERAVRAYVRLAVLRGATAFRAGIGSAIAALVLVTFVPVPAAWMVVVLMLLVLALSTVFSPIAILSTEKLHGTLEYDRTLPLSLRAIAVGRLVGAGVRTSAMLLAFVAIAVAYARTVEGVGVATLTTAVILMMSCYWGVLWLGYAISSRFSMRWLVWVPAALWIAGLAVDDRQEAAAKAWMTQAARQLFIDADPPIALVATLVGGAIAFAALAFTVAVAVTSSALARFRHDPGVLLGALGKVPAKEMAAVGRGVLIAVARLRLRLATEQFRREMIVVGVLVVTMVLDVGAISDFAKAYLPILASLVPAMIGMQLIAGRATGTLEALQQLPHPRRLIALGHVLAVMVLAVPALVIHAVSQVADGVALEPVKMALRWFLFLAIGSVVAALAVWATTRRMVILIGVVIGSIMLVAFGGGVLVRAISGAAGPLVVIVLALTTVAIAIQLFAHGLATYQGSVVKK